MNHPCIHLRLGAADVLSLNDVLSGLVLERQYSSGPFQRSMKVFADLFISSMKLLVYLRK